MEEQSLFRKNTLDRVSSPEELTDYLHVTTPAVWVLALSVILLLAGALIWASFTEAHSYTTGIAQVNNGKMIMYFNDPQLAKNVEVGLTVQVGDVTSSIQSVGVTEQGSIFASASISLPNGTYQGSVLFRRTQMLRILFS